MIAATAASIERAALGLWTPLLMLACLALWRHRKDIRGALAQMRPASLRVNVTAFVIDALVVAVPLGLVSGWFGSLLAGIAIPSSLWAALPAPAVIFAAIFLGDFTAYWRHRLEHSPALWPSHVMHHSDTAMTWLTVYRFHPINRLTTVLIDGGALALLGFPAWAIVANSFFRHYYGIFVHMNVPWTLGPLGRVIVSPAMHRWHHVLEGPGVAKNFASVFSVFDRWFGTHYCPGPCDVPLGVPDAPHLSYWRQLALPFRLPRSTTPATEP